MRSKSDYFFQTELETANAILIIIYYLYIIIYPSMILISNSSFMFVIFLPNNREHAARVTHQNNVEAVDRDCDTNVSKHG